MAEIPTFPAAGPVSPERPYHVEREGRASLDDGHRRIKKGVLRHNAIFRRLEATVDESPIKGEP